MSAKITDLWFECLGNVWLYLSQFGLNSITLGDILVFSMLSIR